MVRRRVLVPAIVVRIHAGESHASGSARARCYRRRVLLVHCVPAEESPLERPKARWEGRTFGSLTVAPPAIVGDEGITARPCSLSVHTGVKQGLSPVRGASPLLPDIEPPCSRKGGRSSGCGNGRPGHA